MLVGILALQGDFAAHAAAAARAGAATRLVKTAADLAGLDGLILPGGESTTMLKFLEPGGLPGEAPGELWEALRAFVRQRPVFGTCAGAILLAQRVTQPAQTSLGALDVTAARNAYGRQIDSSIRQARVSEPYRPALGRTLEMVLIRAPRFRDLGPGVEVVAEAGGEPMLVRQGNIVAASFHPELSPDSPVHRWFIQLIESR
ncbi:MAG TPA: pyridoxal 5'-phosphate synthase glutaminase subunit PdxT [Terriglobales bacterium]|nr:pyridoxal 5'-phosphate synthase glutaminase subunit PdxT [Terriglobales bacterium]